MDDPVDLPWLRAAGGGLAMAKNEWGPVGWEWLHAQAIGFPASPSPRDQSAMFARYWAFVQTLPCLECRAHATEYARLFPPDLSGSAGFQTWAWRFHNAANRRLGKPLMQADEYRLRYAERLARRYWGCV